MILIRPYTTKDSTQLPQAINQFCADIPWMSTRSFIPTSAWLHAMEMDDCKYHQLLVAESNDEIVGWCRSFPSDCEAPQGSVELGIGLLSHSRNQGIGSELIMRSLEWAKALDLQKVELTVSPKNSIAVHVFTKCGFEPVSAHDNELLLAMGLS